MDGEVTQRVRYVSECQVMVEAEETLRRCTNDLEAVERQIRAADTGTCVVHNARHRDLGQLKEMLTSVKRVTERVETALLTHMESKHPVVGRGRAVDSGYCGSQATSQVISGVMDPGTEPMPVPPNSGDRKSAGGCCLPIQEEGGGQRVLNRGLLYRPRPSIETKAFLEKNTE